MPKVSPRPRVVVLGALCLGVGLMAVIAAQDNSSSGSAPPLKSAQSAPAPEPASDEPAHRPPAKWISKYIYGNSRAAIALTDFRFPSTERGIASGYLTQNKFDLLSGDHTKISPVMLVTSDGGENWSTVNVKEVPDSLFFLDDTLGWYVSDRGIWFTAESGRSWRRISDQQDLLRVYFLSRAHGFAIGGNKKVLESFDGGATWKPVAVAAQPKTTREWTTYSSISFDETNTYGIITGFSHPPRDSSRPSLADPEDQGGAQVPNESIFLSTKDAGKTWDLQTASLFGEVTHTSFSSLGFGLGLIEFHDRFPWPSEVYKLTLSSGKSDRVFREKDRAITDVLCVPGGDCFLAGTEPPGKIYSSPIPGKVKILRAGDLEHWEELPVDYRAVARRVWLASPGGAVIWAATDTGMILKLQSE